MRNPLRRRRPRSPGLAAVAALLLTSACGQDLAPGTYEGPLSATGKRGAAGHVVECTGPAEGGNNYPGAYDNGALSDDAEEAIRTAFDEALVFGARGGYVRVREDDGRALYTLTHDGGVRQALIVRDGQDGWYVESWARCDYSELPDEVAEEAGYEIWSDADGRVSTRRVQSYAGPAHCSWDDMTFLEIDEAEYVRAPEPDPHVATLLSGAYEAAVALPPDARDTGFHRGEDHLWLSADGAWAFVGDGERVERWPRAVGKLGCM
ncbi:hypothetical protein [Mumia zhuanghuii]|uniref:hypothetical protein n=1 Tax=Mumia zhuanghuii TaxID=2585211 RepID=UPI003624CEBC